jgi:hypothetical protein
MFMPPIPDALSAAPKRTGKWEWEFAESSGGDTFGLQEYFVTDIAVETAGSNVRMICGVRRGGQVHWLYSCVMPAELLIPATKDCARAACESFNTHSDDGSARQGSLSGPLLHMLDQLRGDDSSRLLDLRPELLSRKQNAALPAGNGHRLDANEIGKRPVKAACRLAMP